MFPWWKMLSHCFFRTPPPSPVQSLIRSLLVLQSYSWATVGSCRWLECIHCFLIFAANLCCLLRWLMCWICVNRISVFTKPFHCSMFFWPIYCGGLHLQVLLDLKHVIQWWITFSELQVKLDNGQCNDGSASSIHISIIFMGVCTEIYYIH